MFNTFDHLTNFGRGKIFQTGLRKNLPQNFFFFLVKKSSTKLIMRLNNIYRDNFITYCYIIIDWSRLYRMECDLIVGIFKLFHWWTVRAIISVRLQWYTWYYHLYMMWIRWVHIRDLFFYLPKNIYIPNILRAKFCLFILIIW